MMTPQTFADLSAKAGLVIAFSAAVLFITAYPADADDGGIHADRPARVSAINAAHKAERHMIKQGLIDRHIAQQKRIKAKRALRKASRNS